MMFYRRFCALLAVFVLVPTASAWAARDPINGAWTVKTKLVAAMDPTNPSYRVGDIRIEKWRLKVKGKTGALTSPNGTIAGQKVGKAWVFDQAYDTGLGVVIHLHLVARAKSSDLMKGTIEARYYSAQFGYEIGIDAWSFTGFRKL